MTTTRGAGKRRVPKILFIHRYVEPDIPSYGWMLPKIAEAAVAAGYEAEVFSTRPSYREASRAIQAHAREQRAGVFIRRVSLPLWGTGDFAKAIAGSWFAVRAFFRALRGDYEIVMAATTPPVILARAVSIAARLRRKCFIYHCQDIHPEIAGNEGLFKWTSLRQVFRWLDKQTCHAAARIVVLSQDMRQALCTNRCVAQEKVHVINNFRFNTSNTIDVDALNQALQLVGPSNTGFRLVFAGNLGRFQGLDALIDGLASAEVGRVIELIFIGTGIAEASLRGRILNDHFRLRFLGQQPKPVADAIVATADLAIISLCKGLIRYAYPSKTIDYLAAGVGIMAVVEPDSELGQMISGNGFGVVAQPGNPDVIGSALKAGLERVGQRADLKRSMQIFAEQEFGCVSVLPRWQALFASMDAHN